MNRWVLPIMILLTVRGAGAGTESDRGPDYAIQVWQVEQGLPDNTVTAIEQTPDGYLWFGTFNGLVRFDGMRFEVFDARIPGLESEQILRLCVDQAGAMWVSTESGHLARYAEGHPNEEGRVNRYYQGTQFIDELERNARREIMELFRCRQADVRPISGNAANTAIALGWLRGGDSVIVNSTDAGGHISHNLVGVFGRRIQMRGQTLTAGRDNSVRLHFFPLAAGSGPIQKLRSRWCEPHVR